MKLQSIERGLLLVIVLLPAAILFASCNQHSAPGASTPPPVAVRVVWVVGGRGSLLTLENVSGSPLQSVRAWLDVPQVVNGFLDRAHPVAVPAVAEAEHRVTGAMPDLSQPAPPAPPASFDLAPGGRISLTIEADPESTPAPLHVVDGSGRELTISQEVEPPLGSR